jgi:hypothetical protein
MGTPGRGQWALGRARSADGPPSGGAAGAVAWEGRAGFSMLLLLLLLLPPLLILLMTDNRAIMGERVNGFWTDVSGWTTVVAIFAASIGLVATWFL